jgi:hypothetical protein
MVLEVTSHHVDTTVGMRNDYQTGTYPTIGKTEDCATIIIDIEVDDAPLSGLALSGNPLSMRDLLSRRDIFSSRNLFLR